METMTFKDFIRCAQCSRLGQLRLPNGKVKKFGIRTNDSLSVELATLNQMVSQILRKYGLTSSNVLALIAVGSAVLSPGFRETYTTRKKFILFGPWVVHHITVPIQPNDIDFFLLTDKNLGYDGTHLKKGIIHIVGRGIEQVTRCREVNDTVSIHALREGVPLFFNYKLSSLATKIRIRSRTPRRVCWSEDNLGIINGTIK